MSEPNHPRVAVVMRTRDRQTLLRRALSSVAGQTFRDLVLVVVNDGGDRADVESCIATMPHDLQERVVMVHNPTSSGREAAMNDGLRAASSDLIVLHDDDDTWAPEFLERTVAYLDEHPASVGVATRTSVVFEAVDGDSITRTRTEVLAADRSQVTLVDILTSNFVPPISLLYRRSVHDQVGEYDGSLPVLADWHFLLRMLVTGPIGFIDGDPLAFWHHRETTEGALGNSVVAASSDHQRFDPLIRDQFLRDSIARSKDLGGPLLLAGLFDGHRKQLAVAHSESIRVAVHTDSKVENVNQALEQLSGSESERYDALAESLRALNAQAVSQNNRFAAQLEMLRSQVEQLHQLVYSQTPRQRARSYQRAGGRLLRRLGLR